MIKEISKILNPVHLPTIQEFKDIAFILAEKDFGDRAGLEVHTICLRLMERFEELTRGRFVPRSFREMDTEPNPKEWQPILLKKEMFENPYANPYQNIENIRGKGKNVVPSREWELQQEKIWFSGDFKIDERWGTEIEIGDFSFMIEAFGSSSLFHFIVECGANNVKINFTDNFIKQLINI